MSQDYERLKNIVRSNIKSVKDIADNLFFVRDKLDATQETVEELLSRVESLESKSPAAKVGGVMAFSAGSASHSQSAASHQIQALDLEPQLLPELISQHPSWLRPFTVEVELEKPDPDSESLRLIRSKAGYLRVIRLTNGSEWAYFEEMSRDRFLRIPLMSQLFNNTSLDEATWTKAWNSLPARLQTLQRGSRWEVYEFGQFIQE